MSKPNASGASGPTDHVKVDDVGTTKPDAASIISSSAEAVDSVAGFVGLFVNPNGTATAPINQTAPPPPEQQPNWLLIGGIGGSLLLIIALLYIASKNGSNKSK